MQVAKTGWVVLWLLLGSILTSCIKDNNKAAGDICDANRLTIQVASDQAGRISYDNEMERWLINVNVPGTIDGLQTCIICGDLPNDIKIPGLEVLFSGDLKESNGYPRPRIGGQEIYYLRPVKIKKL